MKYYKVKAKYQLAEDILIQTDLRPTSVIRHGFIGLYCNGLLKIKKGYAWDGPSGPTFDSLCSLRGSCVHDALYELLRQELLGQEYKEYIDRLFLKILLADGMWEPRARYWYHGVKKCADFAADPRNKRKVRTAP